MNLSTSNNTLPVPYSAVLLDTSNPFYPVRDRTIRHVRPGRSLESLLDDELAPSPYPYIVFHNGDVRLRREWADTHIVAGDHVAVARLHIEGGGGSNPLRTLLLLALVVAAPYLAAPIAAVGTLANAAIAAVITFVGSILINALIPPPKPPSPQSLPEASPTYSLGAQGNTARLEQPVPVHYGRDEFYPEYAAQPYAEYQDNEQYLYQLFSLGVGFFDIESIKFEDTEIENFDDVETEIIEPGGTVTLFPSNVVTSGEVGGQELKGPNDGGDWIGPFAVGDPGTLITKIAVDVVLPRGLFYAADDGDLDEMEVVFEFEARELDENDDPVGSFFALGPPLTIAAKTPTQIRKTYRYDVPFARYEVRARRTNEEDLDSRAANEVTWGALRGYVPDDNTYPAVTLIAMRVRATDQLSGQTSQRVKVLATRKLHTWDPEDGWSVIPVVTRSIAWAAVDALRAEYGGQVPDANIDLPAFWALDQIWTSRGDRFDGRFDQRVVLWEALQVILRCGRAVPLHESGVVTAVRDGPLTVPAAVYSMRNIVRGSFSVEYVMPTRESSDSVRVEYRHATRFKPYTVLAALEGSLGNAPADVKLFGCTDRSQAHREGLYMAAADKYRRRLIRFTTELDGYLPRVSDLIYVSHDLPGWGQSGDVIAVDDLGATLRITTSEPLDFSAGGTHYISFRDIDGAPVGPYVATAGAEDNQCIVSDALAIVPYTGTDRDKTQYQFGPTGLYATAARVMGIRPRGSEQVEIYCVAEDARVHTADGTVAPGEPTIPGLPGPQSSPVVEGLNVVQTGTPAAPILNVSWRPAAGARYYDVQYSTDGLFYQNVGNPTTTNFAFAATPGEAWVRVAGVGLIRGPWAVWQGNAGATVPPPGAIINLELEEPFTGPVLKVRWDEVPRRIDYTVQVWDGNPENQLRRTVNGVQINRFEYSVEDSIEDGGPWRTLTIKVTANGASGSTSPAFGSLGVTNAQVAALTGVSVEEGIGVAFVHYDKPTVADYAGVRVHLGTTAGFTPGPSNLVYDGIDHPAIIEIPDTADFFMKIAGYDVWGKDGLNFSASVEIENATPTRLLAELAGQITETQLYADLNERLDNHDATAAEVVVLGSQVSILSGEVDGAVAAIDVLSDQITLKVDKDGVIAGIGIAVDTLGSPGDTVGNVIVLSDRFSIALPAHQWRPSTAYSVGQYVKPTSGAHRVMRVTVAGTSGASEPTWPASIGGTVVNGTVTFQRVDPAMTVPFVVGLVNGQPAVVISSLYVGDASIGSAQIGDAQITSAKIALAIQSNNYVAGVSGWKIDKTGTIEARNITARGDIEAKSLKADEANIVSTLHLQGQAVTIGTFAYTGGMDLLAAEFARFPDQDDEIKEWMAADHGTPITGATKDSPCRLTVTGHGLFGDHFYGRVTGVAGMTQLNGNLYLLDVVDANHVDLYDPVTENEINSTAFGTWTSGGTLTVENDAVMEEIQSITVVMPTTGYAPIRIGFGLRVDAAGGTDLRAGLKITRVVGSVRTTVWSDFLFGYGPSGSAGYRFKGQAAGEQGSGLHTFYFATRDDPGAGVTATYELLLAYNEIGADDVDVFEVRDITIHSEVVKR